MTTEIMGILNVTPDSFSDGGRFAHLEQAVEQAFRLVAEGASILDIGGESTRPGAEPVSEEEELHRVLPVIEALAGRVQARLSIDTYKPAVAEACLRAGAEMINDVTGLRDARMASVAAAHGAAVVIMHMRGTPATMNQETAYTDVVAEVKEFLGRQAAAARAIGVDEIILDPGIGFAKTASQSFELLRRLGELSDLGYPLLIGPSRKSFLATLPGMEQPGNRLEGTLAASVIGVMQGASIVRVHDVKECRKALAVADAVKG
ncbi:dihydropteroate synthase [Paludibaculum fermentans]|uniref:dihydropteroate synthase n=1 Tax=Paludibaculum fermentans TaxID=1473598 RepID=UPI003EBAF3B6